MQLSSSVTTAICMAYINSVFIMMLYSKLPIHIAISLRWFNGLFANV